MTGYSFWLLPSEEHRLTLARTMDAMALVFGHVRFDAHLTVQGDLYSEPEFLVSIAREEAARTKALSWPSAVLGQSDFFYRVLFLQFAESTDFGGLADRISTRMGSQDGRSPFPHLSLAYGPRDQSPEASELANLLEDFDPLSRDFRFDRLAVAVSARQIPLDQWRILDSFSLPIR